MKVLLVGSGGREDALAWAIARSPKLERLCRQKRNFRLLRVDIDKWNSPVARQHGINRLPTLWLCKDGEVISTDSQEVLHFLQK